MKKSRSMAVFDRPATTRRSYFAAPNIETVSECVPSIAGKESTTDGPCCSEGNAVAETRDASLVPLNDTSPTEAANKDKTGFYKNKDAFSYYSSPDLRLGALLPALRGRRQGAKKDISRFMGLQHLIPKKNWTSDLSLASTGDPSMPTRPSRISLEMHDSVIHEHLEDMLDEVDDFDSDEDSFEEQIGLYTESCGEQIGLDIDDSDMVEQGTSTNASIPKEFMSPTTADHLNSGCNDRTEPKKRCLLELYDADAGARPSGFVRF